MVFCIFLSLIYWLPYFHLFPTRNILTKEDRTEINPWSIVLSLHPMQPFFYIIESGFSHLKRRLLHFPACVSLRLPELSKTSLPFPVVPQRGDGRGRRQELSETKKGSKNELLYMIMEERAALCVSGSKTKRRYLRDPHLTLDFVLLREGDDDCFSPFLPLFVLPPLPHS